MTNYLEFSHIFNENSHYHEMFYLKNLEKSIDIREVENYTLIIKIFDDKNI